MRHPDAQEVPVPLRTGAPASETSLVKYWMPVNPWASNASFEGSSHDHRDLPVLHPEHVVLRFQVAVQAKASDGQPPAGQIVAGRPPVAVRLLLADCVQRVQDVHGVTPLRPALDRRRDPLDGAWRDRLDDVSDRVRDDPEVLETDHRTSRSSPVA